MKNITVTFVPASSIANQEIMRTYPYQSGQPLPVIGEKVSFGDPTKSFSVTARSLHYFDENTLQVFFSFDR